MLTALDMIDAVNEDLRGLFEGYTLPNKAGILQEVKIFSQYMPPPSGIVVAGSKPEYSSSDYEMNFPCIVIKTGEMTDKEEGRLDMTRVSLKLLFGVYAWSESEDDEESRMFKVNAWRDVQSMMDKVRWHWLKDRIIARKFRIEMPFVMKHLDEDTYPLFFGEINTLIEIGRPVRDYDYVYRGYLKNG